MALTSSDKNNLFSPIQLGELTLANRIIMAPLTRNRADEGNVPQDMNVDYYRQRASAGLIISEGSQISATGVGYPRTPGIHSAAQINGWQQVTDAVHDEGGRIFIQLWHTGRISHSSLQPGGVLPVAPSALKAAGQAMTYDGLQDFETPHALALEELPALVADYATAAQNAKAAGFDGVEIHAANGYLLDQFLRDGSNRREDGYGGNIAKRMRLLLEVVEAAIAVWGSHCVGVRLSPENSFNDMEDSQPQQTFNAVAQKLSDYPLAYLHVLEGDMVTGERRVDYQALRSCFTGLYMANNGYDLDGGNSAIGQEYADMVAFGKLFIANPDLPERFAKNWPLNTPDQTTFYGGDEKGYTDYPKYSAK
ncbi:MAG: alkene reductase [Methylobacter sp.]|uniref:alkene reductase n=1 Tax=Methylicorpusculum sp. TaxID=2713644 RepID=UPI00271B4374|nr:alkene reductase [Methylicorpusculum sp.]MDO9140860.1 alkene reductase [Methylobacter sp.]MDP2177493.1 alkene reductase [Methylicorpusculum sp.]MDP2429674.1 alkene reductase [Methylobacter sp.]MDP3055860.1 alkene reductase [Methylobacter sp.]MDP3362238.1 alkene reductase [Methylobacter sp.]